MRSDSWPSPRRSQRSARLRLRPCEEGRCFFQELVLHPQPADLVFHFLHAGALHRIQVWNGLGVLTSPDIEPIAQGALVDPQVAGDLGDGLAGLEHHLHGLSLELRAEPSPLLWHGQILSAASHCPRFLVHPSPGRPAKSDRARTSKDPPRTSPNPQRQPSPCHPRSWTPNTRHRGRAMDSLMPPPLPAAARLPQADLISATPAAPTAPDAPDQHGPTAAP